MDVQTVETTDRRVELSFSSEAPYERWFGSEILCHDDGCVDLSRIGEVATVLFHHGMDRNVGNMPIGRIEKAWVEQGKGKAIIIFDTDENSEKVYQKILSGSLKGVSVGYNVTSWETVSLGATSANGRFVGPCEVALKWEVIEISIEPTPADPTVGVGRTIENKFMEENQMPAETKSIANTPVSPALPAPSTPPVPPQEQVRTTDEQVTLAIENERQRVRDISAICRKFDHDATAFIADGRTVDQVHTAILDTLTKSRTPIVTNPKIEVTETGEEDFRRDLSDGLALRAGISIVNATKEANNFRGMRLRDIAVECLERTGEHHAGRKDDNELFRSALSPQSAFSSILDNTVSKSMKNVQNVYNPTFRKWAGKGSVSDFKGARHYQLSEAGELLPLRENGEFKFDEMRDQSVAKSILTYGRTFGFTREAMINDDLDVLSKIPQAYVLAALRGINKMVYKVLGANPVIYDGVQLFSADHKNVAKSTPTITTALFAEMKRLMRNQKDFSQKAVLNLEPSTVIVPSTLEVEISQFLFSLADVGGANSNVVNVFRNSMDIVVEAELDQYSEKEFYMVTNPMLCDTIEVTYLNGNESPVLESNIPFDKLGMEWRIYQDVGVNCLDYKGMTKGAIE